MSDKCEHGIRDLVTNLPYCRRCDDKRASELAPASLLCRIQRHIAQMAPHQKDRTTGKLLIEAESAIRILERRVSEYQPYADAACHPMRHNDGQALRPAK